VENIKDVIDIEYEIILKYMGEIVGDSRLAKILMHIKDKGSLLAAAKALGIPYSRAWETIAKAERILGIKLLETRRGGGGGGGAQLTPYAEGLLEKYIDAERKLRKCIGFELPLEHGTEVGKVDLLIAHSHDPLLDIIIDKVKGMGFHVDDACIGSGRALAALSLGEVDVACAHLYDPISGKYNEPYIENYWLKGKVEFIGGYWRELVFTYRPSLSIESVDEALKLILQGKLKIINRNVGSGTRVFLEYLLKSKAKTLGLNMNNVKGLESEAYTHMEAARAVASGKADIALVLKYAAQIYGLPTLHATWERFDYIALKERMVKRGVRELVNILNSEWLKEKVKSLPGYSLGKPNS